MKTKKYLARLLAMILTLVFVVLPLTAHAWWIDDGTGTVPGISPDDDASAIIMSGACGENVEYLLKESGNLFIFGTGPMYDYEEYGTPWYSYASSNTTNVYFDSGVTYIGQFAFGRCNKVNTVLFPDTLEEIGDNAFIYAAELNKITLPEGLTKIGDRAFAACGHPGYDGYNFSSVVLPSTIKSIGYQAFYMCWSLKSINLPDGLETIGDYAFGSCLYLPEIQMPDSVTKVGKYAFNSCNRLTKLRLSDNLEVLSDSMLSCVETGASSITSITLPKNLKIIEKEALECCKLQEIIIPGNVESIAEDAFTIFSGTIYFYGDAPSFDPNTFRHNGIGKSVTIRYPDNNATWRAVVGQNYGGNVTWVPTHYHTFVATVTPPTCVSQGYTTYLCPCNQYVYVDDYVDATGVHTYENGVCTVCGDTPASVVITDQPDSIEAAVGQKIAIKVEAEGDGLTYQWYYKDAGMKNFGVSSNKTSAYAYTMQGYMHNRQVYCVVTDDYGNQVTTEVATITRPPVELAILEQPQSAQAEIGVKFSISPKVQGDGLSYQWYYKESYQKNFSASSNRTDSYAYTMASYMKGRQVYCVVTDKYGNQITTEVATISLPAVELEIISQPENVYASVGEKFAISPKVQGDGLTYQWYYKEGYMKEFRLSSNKSSAYAYSMQGYMNNRSVYCVITDQYGNQVTTEAVTIYLEK